MTRQILFLFILASFFLPASLSQAETIELTNGRKIEGTILTEDDATLIVETADGIQNIEKSKIRTIDGAGVGSQSQDEAEAPVDEASTHETAPDAGPSSPIMKNPAS